MEYLRGLKRLREDPDWLSKVGIGSLLLFSSAIIPIVGNIVLQGWMALIVRRAVSGQETPLPRLDFDFDYLGKLFGAGFKGYIAAFVWGLPAAFLVGGSVACLYIGMVFAAVSGGGEELGLAMTCFFAVGLPVLMLLGMIISLPAHVAMIRAELTDDLNQGLQFREVLDMTKRVFRELLIGSIVLAFVQFVMVLISLPLCYLPLFPCLVAMMVARAHFGAQLYALHLERGGQPLQIAKTDLDPQALAPVAF